ncbi:MAG TPA: ABC transporter permease, partial [Gemmatimonadaceae bacterium]
MEEEIRLHIDLRATRLRTEGWPIAAARDEARRRFGNRTNIQERSRDMWGLSLLEQAVADLRFAVRRLRRRPGFSLAAITVAALGIGATTAVFSAIDAALLRPLPFARPSELVTLPDVRIPYDPGPEGRFPEGRHTLDINDVTAMTDVFSHAAAFAAGGLNLTDSQNPQRVRAGVVTSSFFATLGARPQFGRTFDDAEGKPHGARVVVLSDALWSQRFGRRDVIGKSIDLNGARFQVIGVMEPGFSFPNESDLWVPLTVPTTPETFAPFRGFLPSAVVARTARGVTTEHAASRVLAGWIRLLGPPESGKRFTLQDIAEDVPKHGAAIPLQRDLVGDGQTPLAILMGATALLLLIVCANVANLLLSDAAGRRREVALREVLGASSGRITRQFLAESVLLAFAGALVGVAIAPAVLGVLRAAMPANLAGVAPAQLDVRVLAFAVLLAIVTGIVFGLWPALGTKRGDAAETIKSGGLASTASGLGHARRVLITAELALTVMLLVGSGLMLRSLDRVLSLDMGMNPEHVGTLEFSFPRGTTNVTRLTKLRAIIERLERDPSIQSAAVVNDLPLRGNGGIALSITVDGVPKPKSMDEMAFSRYLRASSGYFKTLGIPILRGQTFAATTDSLSPPTAVISETMAKQWWPNGDALGKTFHFGGGGLHPTFTVIGIAADVRESGLERKLQPQMYLPIERETPDNAAIVARGTLPPATLLARLNEAVRAVDPSQAVYNVRMMDA